MTEAMGSATQWLRLARKRWLLWSGIACYVLATPFLAIIVWSAAQVWVGGMPHALDAHRTRSVAVVTLAHHHLFPFAAFGFVSLAIAFIGGVLLHRAVGALPTETEG